MKKLLASVLCAVLAMGLLPIPLDAAGQQTGLVSGRALVDGKPLPNVTVRLRSVDTGQLVRETTAGADGSFSFSGLQAGNFVVETVGANGVILGTSTAISLTAAAMTAANIGVATTAAALGAAGGGLLGLSTTALILSGTVLAAGTTLAIVAVNNNASGSQ